MPSIRILDVPAARATILHRQRLDDTPVPAAALQKLAQATGRPVDSAPEGVAQIIADVRAHGDHALRHYSAALDGQEIGPIEVSPEEIEAAYARLDADLRAALHQSADRIARFHERQLRQGGDWLDEEGDSRLGQLVRPLERVGIYAPGGSALYPSSLLMGAIPARVAGVREIFVISPPSREAGGTEQSGRALVADVTLAAAKIAGGERPLRVFQVGGAQGVAALAYGTESVPAADKILGPGSLFVVLAMKQLFGEVGIGLLPGPTETLLIADETADPALVAADLLAQAEHDVLASALLLTPSSSLAEQVAAEIDLQLAALPRRAIVAGSLQRGSGIVVTADLDEAIALANEYAPEHLCLLVGDPWALLPRVEHAGGVFLGETACEALGDYIVGPSHIMPTGRTARFSSPVNVRDFQKIISIFGVGPASLRETGEAAARIADAEGLAGHAAAIRKRLS